MGNDEKFLQDIEEAEKELKPKFIALASSPIPFMNGTDFQGLARALTARTGIPAFSVPTSGMHDYVYGAGLALAEIAGHFTGAAEKTGRCSEAPTGSAERSTEKRSRKLNLLGATPLDFGPQSAVDAMKKRLKNYGWEILSTWAMGDKLEALSRAGEAAVNLVVSSVGIPAANVLKEKFGTPFLVGTPVEGYEEEISDALERIADRSCGEWVNKKDDSAEESGGQILGKQEELWKVTPEQVIYFQGRNSLSAVSDPSGESREMPDKDEVFFSVPDITIIGEPVTMGSLAAVIEQKYGKKVQLLCPLEITEGLLRKGDEAICGEEAMEEKLKTVDLQKPFLPVLHNVDVQIHEEPDAIRDVLAAQVASPVLWADTVRKMEEAGVMEIYEVGPGAALSGMVKRITKGITAKALNSCAALEEAAAANQEK